MMYLCSGERDGVRYAQKSNKSITKSIKMTFDAESKCAEMRSKFFQEICEIREIRGEFFDSENDENDESNENIL